MKISGKILIVSHAALLIAGFIVGYVIQKEPSIERAKTKIKYLSSTKLGLPRFNGVKLNASSRIYFVPKDGRVDTVIKRVPVPVPYGDSFLITDQNPISQVDNELQFYYYDPEANKRVIDTYQINPSPWKFGVHIDIDSPINRFRPKVGPKISLGYKGFKLNIKAQLDFINPDASTLMAGTSIRLLGNN